MTYQERKVLIEILFYQKVVLIKNFQEIEKVNKKIVAYKKNPNSRLLNLTIFLVFEFLNFDIYSN